MRPANNSGNTRHIYLGHLDELHYVSTSHMNQPVLEQQQTEIQIDKQTSQNSNIVNTNSRESVITINCIVTAADLI